MAERKSAEFKSVKQISEGHSSEKHGSERVRIRREIPVIFLLSLTVLVVIVFASLFAKQLAPYDPEELDLANTLSGVSAQHIFGTDKVGRDIFSRALFGGRTTLISALLVVLISVVAGIPIGLYTGYYGGKLDRIINSVWNIILSFPAILLAFVLMAVIGKGLKSGIIAFGIIYTPMVARVTRSLTITEKNKTYVEAEKVVGVSDTRILFVHILPNCIGTIVSELTLDIAFAILDLAGLSFLGLGVQAPQSDWGYMLSDAQKFLTVSPIQAIIPGVLIILSVLALNLLSNEILDAYENHKSLFGYRNIAAGAERRRSEFLYRAVNHGAALKKI